MCAQLFAVAFHKGINVVINVFYTFPIMLALIKMLSVTRYAQNYDGIIGGSLKHVLNVVSGGFVCIHSKIKSLYQTKKFGYFVCNSDDPNFGYNSHLVYWY